jgi:hypothetical protein
LLSQVAGFEAISYDLGAELSLCCRFISIPKDMGTFNCGAFVAGIVRVSTKFNSYELLVGGISYELFSPFSLCRVFWIVQVFQL